MGALSTKPEAHGLPSKQESRASCFLCATCSSSCVVVGSDGPPSYARASTAPRHPARQLSTGSRQAASDTPLEAAQVLPVLDVLMAARQVVATHFSPTPDAPPTPPPKAKPTLLAHPQLSSCGMSVQVPVHHMLPGLASMTSPDCSSTSNALHCGQLSPDEAATTADPTSPAFYHTLDDSLSADGAITSCTVTTTCPPAANGMVSQETCKGPASTRAAASGRPARFARPPALQLPPSSPPSPGAVVSPSKASLMLAESPCPSSAAGYCVDPVLVASLLLQHSQGRQAREAHSSHHKEPALAQASQPLGLCQLPGHIVHWLACECGFTAYGRPPRARQLADLHTSAYFCAAFCQVVGAYLRTWGKCPDVHATSPTTHPVLYTAQRLASGSTCPSSYTGDNSPAAVTITPFQTPSSPLTAPPHPFISALWPEAGLGPAPPTSSLGAGGISRSSLAHSSPWFDHHALPPLPRFDHQDLASYTHVIACTYFTHVRQAVGLWQGGSAGRAQLPASPTTPGDTLPVEGGGGALQETAALRMACAQFRQVEQQLGRLQTALVAREQAGSMADVVTMYIAGNGDTLASIAAAAQVSEEAVLQANPGLCEDPVLRPHDCLALPVASILPKLYCIQPGETLCSVANKHGITLHKLLVCNTKMRKLNPRAALPGWVVELPGLFGQV